MSGKVQIFSVLLIAAIVFLVENQTVPNIVAMLFYWSLYFLLCFATGRPKLSLVLLLFIIAGIYFASSIKYQMMGRNLHALDFYLYFNWSMYRYFSDLYPSYGRWAWIIPTAIGALSAVLWRQEVAYRSRLYLAGASLMLVALWTLNTFVLSKLHNSGRPSTFWLRDRFHLSSTIFSTLDISEKLTAGSIFQFGVADNALRAFWPESNDVRSCPLMGSQASKPHLVFVLRESAMIPSVLDSRLNEKFGPDRFASDDGRSRKLRVETHGGGTAWTIFSLLSGISTKPFGELRYLVNDFAIDRIDISFVQALVNCGYQSIAITTGAEQFATSRRYFEAIGFEKYHGIEDIAQNSGGDLSDRAVYALLHAKMAAMEKESDKPIVAFVDTTVTHAPYDAELRPDESVDDAKDIASPVLREYVRRIEIGERDLDEFRERLPNMRRASTVVVDFGDHHPYFTKNTSSFGGERELTDDELVETFFRIKATGPQVTDMDSIPEKIDIMFLGDAVLKALRWDVAGYYAFRRRFLSDCRGAYWQCNNGAYAHSLHQYLKTSGALRF
jgi:phosphoglycerol transferase MdoB-like AlkP superfamily enzyme